MVRTFCYTILLSYICVCFYMLTCEPIPSQLNLPLPRFMIEASTHYILSCQLPFISSTYNIRAEFYLPIFALSGDNYMHMIIEPSLLSPDRHLSTYISMSRLINSTLLYPSEVEEVISRAHTCSLEVQGISIHCIVSKPLKVIVNRPQLLYRKL